MSKRESWVWMPHPGHFICSRDCRFHLNTYVGKYIVSTVGEYLPDAPVREILANSRGITLEGRGDERLADFMRKVGYDEIGYKRKYETMVFRAQRSKDGCCPWHASTYQERGFAGYNDPSEALKGHMRFCRIWGAK